MACTVAKCSDMALVYGRTNGNSREAKLLRGDMGYIPCSETFLARKANCTDSNLEEAGLDRVAEEPSISTQSAPHENGITHSTVWAVLREQQQHHHHPQRLAIPGLFAEVRQNVEIPVSELKDAILNTCSSITAFPNILASSRKHPVRPNVRILCSYECRKYYVFEIINACLSETLRNGEKPLSQKQSLFLVSQLSENLLERSYRKGLKETDEHSFQSRKGCNYYYRLSEQGMVVNLIMLCYSVLLYILYCTVQCVAACSSEYQTQHEVGETSRIRCNSITNDVDIYISAIFKRHVKKLPSTPATPPYKQKRELKCYSKVVVLVTTNKLRNAKPPPLRNWTTWSRFGKVPVASENPSLEGPRSICRHTEHCDALLSGIISRYNRNGSHSEFNCHRLA
ncbi:hypothetical protein L9F63_009845, partial [Diploptera punctata]